MHIKYVFTDIPLHAFYYWKIIVLLLMTAALLDKSRFELHIK